MSMPKFDLEILLYFLLHNLTKRAYLPLNFTQHNKYYFLLIGKKEHTLNTKDICKFSFYCLC